MVILWIVKFLVTSGVKISLGLPPFPISWKIKETKIIASSLSLIKDTDHFAWKTRFLLVILCQLKLLREEKTRFLVSALQTIELVASPILKSSWKENITVPENLSIVSSGNVRKCWCDTAYKIKDGTLQCKWTFQLIYKI